MSKPTVIFCGDLFAETGISRFIRSVASACEELGYSVAGVSKYECSQKMFHYFPGKIITENDLITLNNFNTKNIIIQFTHVSDFKRYPGLYNIGNYIAESDTLPMGYGNDLRLKMMDRLWVATPWLKEVIYSKKYHGNISIIPWPQANFIQHELTTKSINVFKCWTIPQLQETFKKISYDSSLSRKNSSSLEELFNSGAFIALSIQTDVARKGWGSLFVAWLLYLKQNPKSILIIKTNSININKGNAQQHLEWSTKIQGLCRRYDVKDPNIFFIYDYLTEENIQALLSRADVFLSATQGEGFCGPVVESFINGTPVICPRHTALTSLINENYPFIVPSTPHILQLYNDKCGYSPATTWHLVDPIQMAQKIVDISKLSPPERQEIAEQYSESIRTKISRGTVLNILREEFENIKREQEK